MRRADAASEVSVREAGPTLTTSRPIRGWLAKQGHGLDVAHQSLTGSHRVEVRAFDNHTFREYRYSGAARTFFTRWYWRATHNRLKPIAAVAKLIRRHLRNLLTSRPPPPLAPDMRRRLVDFYRDDVLALQDLIGRDLSRWLA